MLGFGLVWVAHLSHLSMSIPCNSWHNIGGSGLYPTHTQDITTVAHYLPEVKVAETSYNWKLTKLFLVDVFKEKLVFNEPGSLLYLCHFILRLWIIDSFHINVKKILNLRWRLGWESENFNERPSVNFLKPIALSSIPAFLRSVRLRSFFIFCWVLEFYVSHWREKKKASRLTNYFDELYRIFNSPLNKNNNPAKNIASKAEFPAILVTCISNART